MARVTFGASGSEALETAAKIVRCFWAAKDHATLILRDLGVSVEHIVLPWGPEVMEAALTHLRMIFSTSSAAEPPADRECMTPFARQFADAGLRVTVPFNMLSIRPALSLPCWQVANGVPVGLQIAGRPFDDNTFFRAALAFEAACPNCPGAPQFS